MKKGVRKREKNYIPQNTTDLATEIYFIEFRLEYRKRKGGPHSSPI